MPVLRDTKSQRARQRRPDYRILLCTSTDANPATPIPPWIANRLSHPDLNHRPIAKYFEHLAPENTAKSRAMLVEADRVADELGLDDELLDSLVVGLRT
jgi:hypothetical protein